MIKTLATLLVGLLLASPAMARSAKRVAKGEKGDKGAKEKGDEDPEFGPWKVRIPGELRGKGYDLWIDGDNIPLDGETVVLKGDDLPEEILLTDRAGRVHSRDSTWVDRDIFKRVGLREWRLGLFGGATTVQGDDFRGVLQDGTLSEWSFEAAYQPGALGVTVASVSQSSDVDHEQGITSSYDSTQLRVAALYEFVPFRRSGGFGRKLHALVHAGAFVASHRLKIQDSTVTIQDEDTNNFGPFLGLDLMYPVLSFWLGLKGYVSQQTIEFEKLDFKTKSLQHGLLLGGVYAF